MLFKEKSILGTIRVTFCLYNNANLIAIPSLYEAGSGPLFEAMYYSRPVICSNVTSLPESIGDCEFVFDPLNLDEISNLILRGLYDKDFIMRNKLNSAKRMEQLKELNYENIYLNALELAINNAK